MTKASQRLQNALTDLKAWQVNLPPKRRHKGRLVKVKLESLLLLLLLVILSVLQGSCCRRL
jgi:hypothetical protein